MSTRAHPRPQAAGNSTAFDALVQETVALFHRLRAVAEQVHRQGALSGGRRGVLRGLDRYGPQTVPQMARLRPVSRQHIQMLVNALAADKLVEPFENPAHRRSHLVRLTPRGKRMVDDMNRKESELLARFVLPVPEKDLQSAVSVLRAVREALASERWNSLVQSRSGKEPRRSTVATPGDGPTYTQRRK